jgi:hypothetical protein
MRNETVKTRCHDRELRATVYAGFKKNLVDIRGARLAGEPWSVIVTGLIDKGVNGATIHRLLAWVRTPRYGAWELDGGQPGWAVKIGAGKGRRSVEQTAPKAASAAPLPPPNVAGRALLPEAPEHYVGDQFDLTAKAAAMTDDELRDGYPYLSNEFWDHVRATTYAYTLERKYKAALAGEIRKRGITGVTLDPEDIGDRGDRGD